MSATHRSIRVLHITGSMDPLSGGPCQGIRTSTPTLETLGVYREVVCFDEPTAAYLGTDSFPIHALGVKRNHWYYSPKLIPWLRDNYHRFDVVVTNGLWLYHSSAIRKVVEQYRKKDQSAKQIKWFVMPHGMLDPYFQQAVDRKLKAFRNWVYWKLLESKVVRQADGVLFTCETELLRARETFTPYKPQREINVGYGIKAPSPFIEAMREAFIEKCPAVAKESFLLFLSRIHPKKGIDLLLKAYMTLGKQLASTGMPLPKLVIAGPGLETDFGQSMSQLVDQDPFLTDNVVFPGMLTGEAKWGAFYGCEAFILPSHQENFGIAVAEALACSKPVLISNQVNIWHEIETAGGGLVAENSLEGTLQLLQQWSALSPSAKQQMSMNARATFEKYFAVEPAAVRFKEAISSEM